MSLLPLSPRSRSGRVCRKAVSKASSRDTPIGILASQMPTRAVWAASILLVDGLDGSRPRTAPIVQ